MRRLAMYLFSVYLLALLALATLAPVAARAGEYRVMTCTTEPAPTGGEDLTPLWDASLVTVANRCGDLRQVQVNARASTTFPNSRGGKWRLVAPPGSRLRRVRVQAEGRFPDAIWGIVDVLDGERSLQPRAVPNGGFIYEWSGDGTTLQGSLECVNWSGGPCTSSAYASYLLLRNWDVTLLDASAPSVAPLTGGLASGRWQRGSAGVDFHADDAGGGIERVELRVDGQLVRADPSSCARSGGVYSRVRPCPGTRSGTLTLDTAALADGSHDLQVAVWDAGGNGWSREATGRVDNTAPARPRDVTAPEAWRRDPAARVTWTLPPQGAGSPVAAAWVQVGGAAPVRLAGARTAADVVAPADGETPVRVWLEDEAGNADPSSAAAVTLRVDREPPGAVFGEQDPADPQRVRLLLAPDRSGIATATLGYRLRGESGWRTLDSSRHGDELLADLPDEQLTAGVYELRGVVTDGAGNVTEATGRGDGRPAIVEAPLRRTLRLAVELTDGGAARGADAEVAQAARPALTGALREPDGRWVAGAALVVEQAIDRPGEPWRALAETATDAEGRFTVPLGAGPSRRLRVRFAGSRTQLPVAAEARLAVRAATRLSASPARQRNGRSVRFSGRLLPVGTAVPRGGKLVVVQFLERPKGKPARWRPMRVVRTDRHGRFVVRHRFRTIRRTTRISFRAAVPVETGFPWAWGASPTRRVTIRPR